jgi:pteridine reductase
MNTALDGERPIALVTGASKRVGRAIACEFARRGFDIVAHSRLPHAECGAGVDAELAHLGARVLHAACDFDEVDLVEAWAADLARRVPRVDVVVHSASTYEATPFNSITGDDALRHFRVNALAPLVISRQLAPRLLQSSIHGGGAIVAIADMHAMGRPRKGFAAYSMSKAALIEMVRSLSRDLAPGVRVNAIAPGVVAFPGDGPESCPEFQEEYLRRVPLARAGTPTDAAKAVAWLALDAAYITGEVVRLDGGRWLA